MTASQAMLRIIDANANRVREAIRVVEDVARFALDDASLMRDLKQFRHEFQSAVVGFDSVKLLLARNTPEDVGVEVKTDTELSRADLRSIVGAACGRLTEALRSIEEAAKVEGVLRVGGVAGGSSGGEARRFESLRYRAYELERRVMLAMPAGGAGQWRLCVLLTESLCMYLPWLEVARVAAAAGADCIQLREKDLDGGELLTRAERLRGVLPSECDLIINDRPDIAVLSGAQGVHLGQTDTPIDRAREIVGSMLVGVSTSNMDDARRAVRSGADYCGVGPMFATTTKRKDHIVGPLYLREYLADPVTAACPHVAIGGVNADTIGTLAEAGCRGVAVSSAVCSAKEPGEVCRALRAGLESITSSRRPAQTL